MVDDRAAMDIAQLVAEHHQVVYRYAFRLTGSIQDAEDLTQQVFLKAQQKLGQIRQQESVRGWLFAILRNYFLKNCQKRRPMPAGSLSLNIDALPAPAPNEGLVDQEQLQAALDQLPPKYRLVLTMFYFEDCSYRDIADQLQLPIGTVMSRLARAKGHLRNELFSPDRESSGADPHSTAGHRG
jgi:RNA polymerase sigma-70 factor, ECF subfamily